ncbi:16S rRNA (guanine(966)-N(2))-methyltransferase RsmD [Caldimonas sp. KR1-144]|uniref:16S rRNA (guanine(966)-N(2))-methyltransferase RsmD n=1 Tax=Caldimonas sp. KR1-144 TaxID=3400911 RepID=UPI003C0365B8
MSSASRRSATSSASRPAGAPGQLRIIGGQWRRLRLPVPDAPGLRPTPDRVRETLFNWLGQDLDGWRVLDAFAGSGALGFEAASRGAAEVLLIERDARLARGLEQSRQRLNAQAARVLATDALGWMRRAPPASFELVLLDPPFGEGLFEPALAAAAPLVVDGGWLYLEADRAFEPASFDPLGLALHRHLRAGAVHAHLLRRTAGAYTAADAVVRSEESAP